MRGKVAVAADDLGEKQLKNIERSIRVYRIAAEATPSPERPALALPDKPSIAVLPFQNMSGDPEQEYFADGMVEEIITALSRFHGLFVIARNSTFTYKGKAVDIKQVARELGVRYVVEGSVRKSGQKVRITGQLIEAATGAHLWADRFDGDLADVFALQDEVAVSIVGAIEPKLLSAEIERAKRKPTESFDAYDHLLRAYEHQYTFTREGSDRALVSLRKALECDPLFAGALGFATRCYQFQRNQGWAKDPAEEAKEACRPARLIAGGNREDPSAVAFASMSLVTFERDYETATDLIAHALRLNANSFPILAIGGWVRLYTHDLPEAVLSFQKAYRLNAVDPLILAVMSGLSDAYRSMGQIDEGLRWARLATAKRTGSVSAYQGLVLALVAADRFDEARAAMQVLLKLDPTLSVTKIGRMSPYREHVREQRMEAYRKAGMPE